MDATDLKAMLNDARLSDADAVEIRKLERRLLSAEVRSLQNELVQEHGAIEQAFANTRATLREGRG